MTSSAPSPKTSRSGSPSTGEPEYLVVGAIRRPHGLRGEMIMDVITDFPERLQANVTVFWGEHRRPVVIDSSRALSRGMLIKLRGIDTPEAASALRNQQVFVTAADRPPLPPGHYYHHQLVGITVVDQRDQTVGELTEILQTGANDVYVVKQSAGGEILLPALESVVLQVDLERRIMLVRVPEAVAAQQPRVGESHRKRRSKRRPSQS